MKKLFSVLPLFVLIISGAAQGIVITPLNSNPALFGAKNTNQGLKRAPGDTLKLPFFEDFTGTGVYPDPARWVENMVYVNSHFPISPPGYGVATFDNLDEHGAPYHYLSGTTSGPSDTLTSKPINLKNFISGVNTIDYTLADSIYLSFFYQAQGLGDILDNSDSLVLRFKDTGENWTTVCLLTGKAVKPFKQVLVGIKNVRYLFNGFQFQFINYTINTGNMNQWHLDYIRMRSGRNAKDTAIADIGVNAVPSGPLRWYSSMPYDHFKQDQAGNLQTNNTVFIRNNNDKQVNVNFGFQAKDQLNNIILDIPSSSSARNIDALSDSSENFVQMNLGGLISNQPYVNMKFTVLPQSLSTDNLQNTYAGNNANNEFTKKVAFKNYYAYDDGTAEGGYGLDYTSIPSGPGYAAIKFRTYKSDTLRGISVFFNRSVADVSSKPFDLMVWKTITEPPANDTKNDVVLRSVPIAYPTYMDTINGFVDYVFDTAVVLPPGIFYIGWKQTIPYILNVGYDNNYKYDQQDEYRNPNLFYNLLGTWQKVSANITGVPMMRPIVGAKVKTNIPGSVQTTERVKTGIYPNPGNGSLNVSSQRPIVAIRILDMMGKEVYSNIGENISQVDITPFSAGMYNIILMDDRNQLYNHKYIKTE